MSYVKYREDDIKITDDRKFMKDGQLLPYKIGAVRYFDCKYCHTVFTTRDELYLHIKSAHNIVRPLVVVNGKIANDHCIIHYLESAYIDLFGYSGFVTINGNEINIGDNDEIDITPMLSKAFNLSLVCYIAFQSITVEIELAEISVENNLIITSVIDKWEQEIADGVRLSTYNRSQLKEGSRLFLDGMYNYYVACRAKKDKAKRYDDALAFLSRFNDLNGLGSCVLKIIAYRRNWLSRLGMLVSEEVDIFSIAMDYYERRPSDLTNLPSVKQIYIEDQTMMSLDLILLFQQHNYDAIRRRLSSIPDIDDFDDLNLIDQLNLLSARLALIEGNRRNADKFYNKLITPAFRDEYTQYKKGLVRFVD